LGTNQLFIHPPQPKFYPALPIFKIASDEYFLFSFDKR
jgi:hypothetical protein